MRDVWPTIKLVRDVWPTIRLFGEGCLAYYEVGW